MTRVRDKRWTAVQVAALATVAAAALAACGNSGGVGGSKSAKQAAVSSGQTVTLNYETWYPDSATLQKAIDGFEQSNPNIKVNLRVLKSQDFQKQLPLQLNGGESLDVVGLQVSAMTNTVNSQLRSVDSYSSDFPGDWKSQLNPTLLQQAQNASKDKVLYDIPMGGVASAYMYYNNTILQKAGVTPPKTIADLAADVTKIKAADPSVTTPVVFTGEGWWQEEMLFTFAGQKAPTLSDSIIHGTGSWNQPGIVTALKDYKSAFSSGAVQNSVLSLSGGDPDTLFYSGKAAFLIGGSWEADVLSASYRQQNKISNGDWGATAVPTADGAVGPAVRSLAEGGLAIPKSSKYVTQAAKFIAYMTYGAGVDLWNANLAYTPVAKVGWQPPASVLTTEAARTGLAEMGTLAAQPGSERDSQQDFLNNVEGPAILDVLRGKTTAEQAAANLQAAWTSGRYPHGS